MPAFLAGLFALYLLLTAIKQFGRLKPATAARLAKQGGAALGVLSTILLAFRGRFGLVGMIVALIAGVAGAKRAGPFANGFQSTGARRGAERVSTARSPTIIVQLDLDTGVMSGDVLAGPFVGRALASLSRSECLALLVSCRRDDADGAALLEAYLDRRFAGWRQANEREGEGRRGAGDSAVTRREAYEVLGLAPGATAEDIIRAHRRLMKKFHPDHGGSTALAARVNQAKDVLLDRHG